jgi:hypothetical protein
MKGNFHLQSEIWLPYVGMTAVAFTIIFGVLALSGFFDNDD